MPYIVHDARIRRKARIRGKISGTAQRPRLSVYRSSRYISAQIIDDQAARTLVAASEKELAKAQGTKSERAKLVGKLLAQKAVKEKITTVRFDRNGYTYHGRVQALADGAREGGLQF